MWWRRTTGMALRSQLALGRVGCSREARSHACAPGACSSNWLAGAWWHRQCASAHNERPRLEQVRYWRHIHARQLHRRAGHGRPHSRRTQWRRVGARPDDPRLRDGRRRTRTAGAGGDARVRLGQGFGRCPGCRPRRAALGVCVPARRSQHDQQTVRGVAPRTGRGDGRHRHARDAAVVVADAVHGAAVRSPRHGGTLPRRMSVHMRGIGGCRAHWARGHAGPLRADFAAECRRHHRRARRRSARRRQRGPSRRPFCAGR
mmetsp:Transcript_10898/g.45188  ORF Transcript_10898/g.45188 Transcript_10898/m.45188 type:complete len:260 (-) Transcript_10898:120-899(-)